MNIRLIGAAVCSAVVLSACATVTRGTTNQIQILSEPAGASVRTSLNQTCTTPCTLTVGRKDEFAATISMPGFKDQLVEIKTRVAGAGAAGFVGNVIVGGIIGMGADAVTGATLEHFPNPVEVKLERLTPSGPPARTPSRR
jgi:PEGA domain